MKKLKICGMGNEDKFNYLILDKNPSFFDILSSLLYKAFEIGDDSIVYDEYMNKNDDFVRRKKNINNFVDKYERFKNKQARVEIFYGKRKIFISVYTSLEKRKKFLDLLEDVSIWKKPEKLSKKFC